MAETERKRPRLKDLPGGQVTELIVIVIMALAIALAVQWLLVKPYRIPSGSMEPTLDVGQRVLVNRLSHRLGADPKVGDIITFHPPAGADETPPRCGAQQADDQPCPAPTPEQSKQTFIKRVVGVGGDRISVRDGHVVRNGKLQSEPFIAPCAGGQGCDLPRDDHRPARLRLLHGRQPRRVRRRPLLGADPDRLGHRRGLRDLLAAEAHRHALAAPCISGQPAALLRGMAAGSTRISGRTWRRVGGLAAVGLVIAALGSGHSRSSEGTSPSPSAYPTSVGAPSDTSVDPAAELERQRQAAQALQEGSQQSYDAAQNTAGSLTP